MSVPTENLAGATEIRPFRIEVPDEALDDLRRRIAATRWPSRELVADRSQGVQLATVQALARYWTTDYDWRKAEAKLNALPQFTTTIDGVDIHFLHVKSPHEHALPLLMTHGWPGSVIELLETVGPLADPTSHGGRAEDAFQLVLPSLPGYGFSGEPADLGWNVGRVAQAWAELMRRLGRNQQAAQGRRQLLHRHPPLRPRRPGRELRVLPRGQHDPRAERAAQTRRLALPVLAIAGAESSGAMIPDTMKLVADDVEGVVVPNGHWVAEQAPEELLAALTAFLAPTGPEFPHERRPAGD
jgi:pimeloyl-ACP methyl ester carboxylesterase